MVISEAAEIIEVFIVKRPSQLQCSFEANLEGREESKATYLLAESESSFRSSRGAPDLFDLILNAWS
jgi:hypothetical protein